MGDIGPVRRHFEVLSGADLEGPSFERLAQVSARADQVPRRTSTAPPPAAPGERDDASAD